MNVIFTSGNVPPTLKDQIYYMSIISKIWKIFKCTSSTKMLYFFYKMITKNIGLINAVKNGCNKNSH